MLAVQEACARIALHTGVGLGTSLRRKFPSGIVGACIVLLFCANTSMSVRTWVLWQRADRCSPAAT